MNPVIGDRCQFKLHALVPLIELLNLSKIRVNRLKGLPRLCLDKRNLHLLVLVLRVPFSLNLADIKRDDKPGTKQIVRHLLFKVVQMLLLLLITFNRSGKLLHEIQCRQLKFRVRPRNLIIPQRINIRFLHQIRKLNPDRRALLLIHHGIDAVQIKRPQERKNHPPFNLHCLQQIFVQGVWVRKGLRHFLRSKNINLIIECLRIALYKRAMRKCRIQDIDALILLDFFQHKTLINYCHVSSLPHSFPVPE